MQTTSVQDLLSKKFSSVTFEETWLKSIGEPEENFKMLVYGDSGNGKTDYCVKLAKQLCKIGKVGYGSREEGKSKTIKEAFERNKMIEVKGRVILMHDFTFDSLVYTLSKKNSPKIFILDSIDFLGLTFKQYKILVEQFKNKCFVFVSWAQSKHPKTQAAKDIEFNVDIKVLVDNYVAFPRSRYGGNEPFIICEEKARMFHPLLFSN